MTADREAAIRVNPIWHWTHRSQSGPGLTRVEEVICDETPGFEGWTVRSWLTDGIVTWDYVSHRYERGEHGWMEQ
jgi:uncharacterized protein CbrC (UPF0167 family)